jgi:hypothetical protein
LALLQESADGGIAPEMPAEALEVVVAQNGDTPPPDHAAAPSPAEGTETSTVPAGDQLPALPAEAPAPSAEPAAAPEEAPPVGGAQDEEAQAESEAASPPKAHESPAEMPATESTQPPSGGGTELAEASAPPQEGADAETPVPDAAQPVAQETQPAPEADAAAELAQASPQPLAETEAAPAQTPDNMSDLINQALRNAVPAGDGDQPSAGSPPIASPESPAAPAAVSPADNSSGAEESLPPATFAMARAAPPAEETTPAEESAELSVPDAQAGEAAQPPAPAPTADTAPLPVTDAGNATRRRATPVPSSEDSGQEASQPVPPPPVLKRFSAATPNVCFRIGPYADKNSAAKVIQQLAGSKYPGAAQIRQSERAAPAGVWVYLPPYPSRQAAQAEETRLEKLGIRDHYLVTQPPFANAISLGFFQDENSVVRRLAELRAKGYYNAQIETHYEGSRNAYWVETRLPDEARGALSRVTGGQAIRQVSCEDIAMSAGTP